MRATPAMPGRHGRIWNVDGSGCATMSASCTRANPSIAEPSKPTPFRERLRQLLRGDRERLQEPEDVGEPQPDEPDLAFLGRPDDERANVVVHPSSLRRRSVSSVRSLGLSHERRRGAFLEDEPPVTNWLRVAGGGRGACPVPVASAHGPRTRSAARRRDALRARVVSRAQRSGRRVARRAPASRRRDGDARHRARRGRRVRPRRALPAERHRRDARPRPPRGRLGDRGTGLVSRLGPGAAPGPQRLHGSGCARAGCGRSRHRDVAPLGAARGRRSAPGREPRRRCVRSVAEALAAGAVADRRPRRAAAREGGRHRVPSGARPEGGPRRPAGRARAPVGGGGAGRSCSTRTRRSSTRRTRPSSTPVSSCSV